MLKGVIFDFDGVIIDSPNYHIAVRENYFLEKHNVKVTKQDNLLNLASTKSMFFDYMNKKYKLNLKNKKEYIKEITNIIKKKMPLMKLNPGVLPLLKTLKKNNIKLAISSSSQKDYLIYFLKKLKIQEYFDVVVGSDMIKNPKPHKDAFEKPLKLLKLNEKNVVGIEDAPQGIISMQKNKITPIAIVSKYSTKKSFRELKVPLIVSSTKEITFSKIKKLLV